MSIDLQRDLDLAIAAGGEAIFMLGTLDEIVSDAIEGRIDSRDALEDARTLSEQVVLAIRDLNA